MLCGCCERNVIRKQLTSFCIFSFNFTSLHNFPHHQDIFNFKAVTKHLSSQLFTQLILVLPQDFLAQHREESFQVLSIFCRMIITLGYDAISKNVEGLGMSPFILFSLSASAILPACLVLLALQDRIGRKAMASSSLLVSGFFTASTGIVLAYQTGYYPDPVLLAVLSIIGRFGVTVAYNSGAQYAAELIPTCVRGQGVAAAHVAGYALTFFSSYILFTVSCLVNDANNRS